MVVKTYLYIHNVSNDSPVIKGVSPSEKIVAAMRWVDKHHLFWLNKDEYIYCKHIVEISGYKYKKSETDYDLVSNFAGTKITKIKRRECEN